MSAPGEKRVVRAFVGYFAKSRSYDHEYLEIGARPLASLFLVVPEGAAGMPPQEYLAGHNGLADYMRELVGPGEELFLHGRRAPAPDAPPQPVRSAEQFESDTDGYVFDYAVGPAMFDSEGLRWRRLREVIGSVSAISRYADDPDIAAAGPPKAPRPLIRVLSAKRTLAELVGALERVCARRGEGFEQVRGHERLPLWRPW